MRYGFANFSLGAGNLLVLGQAKTGKSTILKWIAIHFMRAGGNVLYFDIDKGAYVTTKCVSGTHVDLDAATGQALFTPLQTLSEKRANEFVLTLLAMERIPLTPFVTATVSSAVKMVKLLPTKEQTISKLLHFIMDPGAKEALRAYSLSEGHYPMFDAQTEAVSFNENWLCLECKRTFESNSKAGGCLSYVFSRVEERTSTEPLLIIIDDAAVAFRSEPVVARLPVWINNLRKKNISFAFAVHQLIDICGDLKDTLLNHCNTRVYTPNNQVLTNRTIRESYQSLGISDNQLELLSKIAPQKEYVIQTADGKCQSIDLMIAQKSTAQIITGGSNIDDIRLMENLMAQNDHSGAIELYIKEKGGKHV
jgi:type IV secretion system protein TrbE